MIHAAIAERAGEPHWQMADTEAARLMERASAVLRHYDIAASQKMIDWGGLVTVAMASYLPRLAASVHLRNAAATRPPVNVTPMPAPAA